MSPLTLAELEQHRVYMDGLRYRAIGILRAMARSRPERLTPFALETVRDYDYADALLWNELGTVFERSNECESHQQTA